MYGVSIRRSDARFKSGVGRAMPSFFRTSSTLRLPIGENIQELSRAFICRTERAGGKPCRTLINYSAPGLEDWPLAGGSLCNDTFYGEANRREMPAAPQKMIG